MCCQIREGAGIIIRVSLVRVRLPLFPFPVILFPSNHTIFAQACCHVALVLLEKGHKRQKGPKGLCLYMLAPTV